MDWPWPNMTKFSQQEMKSLIRKAGKVGVLMGGASAERAISLKSGIAVCEGLALNGFNVETVDWDGKSLGVFDGDKFQSFFIALHGRGGEDGSVEAILDIKFIPYTGSGVLASALGMDKRKAKTIWRHQGLRTPDFVSIKENTHLGDIAKVGFPMVIKPPNQGSSIGVSIVRSEQGLKKAIEIARRYDSEVMAEQYIEGSEYTVPVICERPMPTVKIETDRDFYDYAAKYDSSSTRYVCPSDLDESEIQKISSIAVESYRAIGCEGWGRVDFIKDQEGNFELIEINTVPGMTNHSLVPMSAKSAGIEFSQLVTEILAHGLDKSG